jgi:protein-tyrosine-phosphatase
MSTEPSSTEPHRIAFICVQNAGRSQISTAFAERERERRGLEAEVEILTGGTNPADHVHEEVREVMAEVGVDRSGRVPRKITISERNSCGYVATMGCSTLDVGDVEESVDVRDWALIDPDGKDLEAVRESRDEIERRVVALFEEFSSVP